MFRRNVVLTCLCLLEFAFAFVAPSKRTVPRIPSTHCRNFAQPLLASNKDKNEENLPKTSKKKKPTGSKTKKPVDEQRKKEQVAKVAAEFRKDKSQDEEKKGILDMLDPFQAGKKFRKTVEALTGTLSQERRSVYYVDDRFNEPIFSERNPLLERMEADDYVPEVLVIGASGEVGRLVVRRLLLEGRCRVPVLVRDLYSKTLNLLGTGVTYCQGDLGNIESLEYALTDVDKIVFCAGAPRPDEMDFQDKFQLFCQENMDNCAVPDKTKSDLEWGELEGVLQVRAKLAEQVDCIGMQNLVRAYQNVRHADYGTSQAAKRSLFKFQDRPEDFNLFALEEDQQEDTLDVSQNDFDSHDVSNAHSSSYDNDEDEYEDTYADYEDEEDDYDKEEYAAATMRKGAAVKIQCQWIQNKFGHGVFVGKVPKQINGLGGEAAIVSTRLRSREEPEKGIDLSNGFAGLVCRVCSDGGMYEAFVRCGNYGTDGIEYVCEFSTETKPQQNGNKSRNKFKTVRLPFDNFKPVRRRETSNNDAVVPPFKGNDVHHLGFRYRSENNPEKAKFQKGDLSSFYLAFSYIKVYRSQPEPEFVYLSDSRIPPVIRSNMVRHDIHQIVTSHGDDNSYKLLDQAALNSVTGNPMGRSSEETYFKYHGEEILKSSGLSYTIVRVSGFNELPSGEASTIKLTQSNEEVMPVSRAEAAQVCASALLDPNALNKSLYVSKAKRQSRDLSREEDMSSKFSELQPDPAR